MELSDGAKALLMDVCKTGYGLRMARRTKSTEDTFIVEVITSPALMEELCGDGTYTKRYGALVKFQACEAIVNHIVIGVSLEDK